MPSAAGPRTKRLGALLLAGMVAAGLGSAAQPEESLAAGLETALLERGIDPVARRQFEQALEELREARRLEPAPDSGRIADAYGEIGRLLHAYGMAQEAEPFYRLAHDTAPGVYRWRYYLAVVLERMGQLEEAIDLLQNALLLEPQRHGARLRLAGLYLDAQQSYLGEALLRQALREHPDCARARERQAQKALEQGEFAQAAAMLEALLEADPESTHLHYPLGLAYRGLGELDRAREHLETLTEVERISCDPLLLALNELGRTATHHIFRGNALLKSKDYAAAETSYRKALEGDPESTAAWTNLGAALVRQGRIEEAREAFLEAVRLDPDYAAGLRGLVRVAHASGDAEGAERFSRQALAANPDDWRTSLDLGRLLVARGAAEESLPYFAAVRAADASKREAWRGAAVALLALDRSGEALSLLSEAHQHMPEDRGFTLLLARLLAAAPEESLRDGELAHGLATQLLESDAESLVSSPVELETMALALAELDRCEEARRWQRDAVSVAQFNGVPVAVRRARGVLRQLEQEPSCRVAFEDAEALFPGLLGTFGEELDPTTDDGLPIGG